MKRQRWKPFLSVAALMTVMVPGVAAGQTASTGIVLPIRPIASPGTKVRSTQNDIEAPDAFAGVRDGESVLVVGGAFSKAVALGNGSNPVAIEAWDRAGNLTTRTVVLRLDGAPPQIEVLEPPENFEATEPRVHVVARVTADDLAEVRISRT